jgi:branched-chain amino acid transport system ATP-binding protein
MAELLEIAGVHTFYGHIEALHGVDLTIHKGEIVTLIGANGAGKSTLLMTICGTPQARIGRIRFDGADITRLPTFEIMRKGIAQSPEGRRIFPRMTVMENLQMGAVTADAAHFDADLERVMTLFPILRRRQGQRGGTLSGGEQQMLALARALMGRPKLLMLDEPSLGLAPLIVREIFRIVRELNENDGLTVLVVEQDARIALNAASSAYVLEVGKVAVSGSSAELREDEAVRRSYLGY